MVKTGRFLRRTQVSYVQMRIKQFLFQSELGQILSDSSQTTFSRLATISGIFFVRTLLFQNSVFLVKTSGFLRRTAVIIDKKRRKPAS
jgi:hypothetical protein